MTTRPRPVPDAVSAFYWEAAARGELARLGRELVEGCGEERGELPLLLLLAPTPDPFAQLLAFGLTLSLSLIYI